MRGAGGHLLDREDSLGQNKLFSDGCLGMCLCVRVGAGLGVSRQGLLGLVLGGWRRACHYLTVQGQGPGLGLRLGHIAGGYLWSGLGHQMWSNLRLGGQLTLIKGYGGLLRGKRLLNRWRGGLGL